MPGQSRSLQNKARACLAQAAPSSMPSAPLWHMARSAITGSDEGAKVIQQAVDYLTCRAIAKQNFSGDEKEFAKELFESFWWGGKFRGYKEAAELADHYVNGGGKTLHLASSVYETSVIVAATADAMKQYFAAQLAARKSIVSLGSGDPGFLRSPGAQALSSKRRKSSEGYLLHGGALLAEQKNPRLKNCDHRFFLQANPKQTGRNDWLITWRVDSVYDFEPFERADYVTEIRLAEGVAVLIPDGLSEYLTHQGVASVFDYWAEWYEVWHP